ncbi:MAG TPA: hypothetical protein VF800_29235 [Telluria sp.]|jgi:hypothetical protein
MTQQQEQTSQAQAAPAPDASALGALLASYDKGFPHAFALWFVAALLFAFGVFIFLLGTQKRPEGVPGSVVYGLYALGVAAMALGLGLGFYIRYLCATQPAYYLFEHGIRTCNRDGEQTALYCDIEDMLGYGCRAVAFRISPQAPWVILGDFPEQRAILKELHKRHTMERFANLFQQTLYGNTVLFRSFRNGYWITRNKVLNSPTFELTLNKQQLTIGDKSIAMDRIGDVHVSFWTEKATIMDKDGAVFHTMYANGVLSFDVMLGVLRCLQRFHSKQPAPQ